MCEGGQSHCFHKSSRRSTVPARDKSRAKPKPRHGVRMPQPTLPMVHLSSTPVLPASTKAEVMTQTFYTACPDPKVPTQPHPRGAAACSRMLLYAKEEAAYAQAFDKRIRAGATRGDPVYDSNDTHLGPPGSPDDPSSHKTMRQLINDDADFVEARRTLARQLCISMRFINKVS
jgi:hypothetical protein